MSDSSRLHPWDGFVTGPENALAFSSAKALAHGEGAAASPLVVYGPAGVGKSRLLAGLVAERLARQPGASLAHLTAEAFASLCSEAASARGAPSSQADDGAGGWSDLREQFRGLDLFVLEDLHALERAPLALEELTHTLDALADAGAAVAVSARSGPAQWSAARWPRRLISRLLGGLVVRLDPPGLASRRRFLLDRARSQGIRIAAEAAEALARTADGYRTLDGWLARLALTARVERRPIDLHLAEALLADEAAPAALPLADSGGRPAPPRASGGGIGVGVEDVARAVAERFGVRLRDLRSASRRRAVVEPRHLAMHLAHEHAGLSLRVIGAYFGRRDPATVRHACRMASARLAADPALAAVAAAIRRAWRPRASDNPDD